MLKEEEADLQKVGSNSLRLMEIFEKDVHSDYGAQVDQSLFALLEF